MTLTPFRGRCHTCGHDHDAEGQQLRDILNTIKPKAPTVTLPPLPKAFMVFDPVGEGTTRCTCGEFPHADDCGDVYAPGQMRRWRDQIVDRLRAAGVEVK